MFSAAALRAFAWLNVRKSLVVAGFENKVSKGSVKVSEISFYSFYFIRSYRV